MSDLDLTRANAQRVHAAATDAFIELVRTMPIDPSRVRRHSWSKIDVAAHVLSMPRTLLDARRGTGGRRPWLGMQFTALVDWP
ncbi:MAG: hypothetical protein SGJ13_17000 [Actinomycetota bacterium]|nr:hypothetical protein [Actinomycetota bacterium]